VAAPGGMSAVLEGRSLGLAAGYETRLVLENNAITTGYQLALLFVVAWLVFTRGLIMRTVERLILLALMGMALFLLLLNGTRGALAALVAAVVVSSARRVTARWLVAALASLVALYIGTSFVQTISPDLAQRYGSTLDTTSSLYQRLQLSVEALTAPLTLLGRGLGSFGAARATERQPIYTHNALTELYYEGGLLGLGLFLAACGTVFARLWRAAGAPNGQGAEFCLAGFVLYFVFTQASGYLLSNAGFWLFLTMGSTCARLSCHIGPPRPTRTMARARMNALPQGRRWRPAQPRGRCSVEKVSWRPRQGLRSA
jgi:O-antigen ligase